MDAKFVASDRDSDPVMSFFANARTYNMSKLAVSLRRMAANIVTELMRLATMLMDNELSADEKPCLVLQVKWIVN